MIKVDLIAMFNDFHKGELDIHRLNFAMHLFLISKFLLLIYVAQASQLLHENMNKSNMECGCYSFDISLLLIYMQDK